MKVVQEEWALNSLFDGGVADCMFGSLWTAPTRALLFCREDVHKPEQLLLGVWRSLLQTKFHLAM